MGNDVSRGSTVIEEPSDPFRIEMDPKLLKTLMERPVPSTEPDSLMEEYEYPLYHNDSFETGYSQAANEYEEKLEQYKEEIKQRLLAKQMEAERKRLELVSAQMKKLEEMKKSIKPTALTCRDERQAVLECLKAGNEKLRCGDVIDLLSRCAQEEMKKSTKA